MNVASRELYVYCYEGELNDIPNAAVILSYLKNEFEESQSIAWISVYKGIATCVDCLIKLVLHTKKLLNNGVHRPCFVHFRVSTEKRKCTKC